MTDGKLIVVLIVDDEPLIRTLLRRVLASTGCTVREAADGLEALEQLEAPQLPEPDIVLTDLQMPRLTGWTLLAMLAEFRPLLPVVCLSGYGGRACDEFPWGRLPKPITRSELMAGIQLALARADRCRAKPPPTGERRHPAPGDRQAALARARAVYAQSGSLVAAARAYVEAPARNAR